MFNSSRRGNQYELILGDNQCQVIEHSKEDNVQINVFGLKKSSIRTIIFNTFSILLLGIPYLVLNWYPNLKQVKYSSCTLEECTFLLVEDNLKQSCIIEINDLVYYLNNQYESTRYFIYQHSKYIWNHITREFAKLDPVTQKYKLDDFLHNTKALPHSEQNELLKLYGPNTIDIQVKSYPRLFITEIFHPFYVFQIFSIILWTFDDYYQYASCILFLSLVSIVTSLYQTKQQAISLQKLVESSNTLNVNVVRDIFGDSSTDLEKSSVEITEALNLVPGEIIVIPKNGCRMPCDAVLLNGLCIVNEAILTGESLPVAKTPPNACDDWYNPQLHKRHTLFSGTEVIQARFYGQHKVFAKVVRTGYDTSKGELIKSILYPKPMGFKFYQDSLRFICFLFFVAAIGMVYSIYLYMNRDTPFAKILVRTLDIITIVVPPALPAAMTAGTVYSQSRLKKRGIYCISPGRINMAGKLKLVCFDKTGTLTNEGLNFYATIPVEKSEFTCVVHDPTTLDDQSPLIQGLATCHSLTRLDGKISGDPLDVNMFDATQWILDEPGSENTLYDTLAPTVVYPPNGIDFVLGNIGVNSDQLPYQIGIIRQFTFSSTEQSMAVICKILGKSDFRFFMKGAPEKVVSKCNQTTVPTDFKNLLKEYALQGYRLIALAYKDLDVKVNWVQRVKREQIEEDLNFLGLLVMQNTLKEETIPVIKDLQNANIRTVMITGDNIMTAISVGRESGMIRRNEKIVMIHHSTSQDSDPTLLCEVIDSTSQTSVRMALLQPELFQALRHESFHFAMEGSTWNVIKNHFSAWIPILVLKGTIFARFGPEQKTQLVTELQKIDYIVGMVGDGANDCGALKAAHIGISLSEAEASVAAPFTSRIPNISCVKHIALEGRCALVTSFAIFKYMAMYSFIQFISVLILYTRFSTLGNWQFLFIDLVITTSLAVSMGRQGPSSILVSKRPIGSLVSLLNIIPLALQVILCGVFQVGALYYLLLQDWFKPVLYDTYRTTEEELITCWDNTVIFTISCFQYIIIAFVYSKGKPYRVPFIANGLILFIFLALTSFCTLLLVYPIEPVAGVFELIPRGENVVENRFRDTLILFPMANFVLAVFMETQVANTSWFKKFIHFIIRKKQPKNKYKVLQAYKNLLLLGADMQSNGEFFANQHLP